MDRFLEKPSGDKHDTRTKTDTGRRGEKPQALERMVVKELGKLTPYVRNKGALQVMLRAQRKGAGDCLSKTQHCANWQQDVYSVTRARCRNVKEAGYSDLSGEACDRSTGKQRP